MNRYESYKILLLFRYYKKNVYYRYGINESNKNLKGKRKKTKQVFRSCEKKPLAWKKRNIDIPSRE